jgi:hypothetical protein
MSWYSQVLSAIKTITQAQQVLDDNFLDQKDNEYDGTWVLI